MDTIITIVVKRDGKEPATDIVNDIRLVLDERFGIEVLQANKTEKNIKCIYFTTTDWEETASLIDVIGNMRGE